MHLCELKVWDQVSLLDPCSGQLGYLHKPMTGRNETKFPGSCDLSLHNHATPCNLNSLSSKNLPAASTIKHFKVLFAIVHATLKLLVSSTL